MSEAQAPGVVDKTDIVLDKILASKVLMDRLWARAADKDMDGSMMEAIVANKVRLGRMRHVLREAGYDTFVNVMKHDFPFQQGEAVGRILMIDTETTDIDPMKGDLIQVSLYSIEHDGKRPVNPENVRVYSSYNDPGYEISEETTSITGITTGDVKGQKINVAEVAKMVDEVDLVIAHSAAFDRKWLETHLRGGRFSEKPWACSLKDVDWNHFGFAGGGKNLTVLALAHGYTFPSHNADSDTKALTFLMSAEKDGVTPLSHMMSRAAEVSFKIIAKNSPFSKKDVLKASPHFTFNGDDDEHGIGQKTWIATMTRENAVEVADILRDVYGSKTPPAFSVQPSTSMIRYSNRSMPSIEEGFVMSDPAGSADRMFSKFEGFGDAQRHSPLQGSLFLSEEEDTTIKF